MNVLKFNLHNLLYNIFTYVKNNNITQIVIETPSGLIGIAKEIEKNIKKILSDVDVQLRIVFGSCQQIDYSEKTLVLHLGHSPWKTQCKHMLGRTMYIIPQVSVGKESICKLLEKILCYVREDEEYIMCYDPLAMSACFQLYRKLVDHGYKIQLYKGLQCYEGCITGCDVPKNKNVILVKSGGYFHENGLLLAKNEVISVDIIEENVKKCKGDEIIKRRLCYLHIVNENLEQTKHVIILNGLYGLQNRKELVKRIITCCEKRGISTTVVNIDKALKTTVENIYYCLKGVLVSCFCPYYAIDNDLDENITICTPGEILFLLGEYSEYVYPW